MTADKVMVVDDEPKVVDSIEFFLSREGYEVATACCGRDALSLISGKPFDLILLDLTMPGMDGFEVMAHLLEIDPELLIIIVTGDATVESAVRALKHGACDYLKKPFEYEDLIKTVKNALKQKRLIKENMAVSARLEASERRCTYMVNNSPDLIFILDTEARFSFINNEFERVLGYGQIDVIGKDFFSFIHSEDLEKCKFMLTMVSREREDCHALQDGQTLQIRFRKAMVKQKSNYSSNASPYISGYMSGNVSVNEFVPVELKVTTMRIPNDRGNAYALSIYGIARDVTERNSLHEQLLQAQKMEAIGTLAGGIAHDFNNILMGIQGYTSLVRVTFDPESPEYKKLTCVEDYVNSGSEMTRQLLGFAQKRNHEFRLININYLIKMSAKMFGRTKKEITIHQNLQKQLWSCEIDEGQLNQVLLNLYVNAWQAMPNGGHIYLKTENVNVGESKYQELGLKKSGQYVRVSVVDTGVGMDREIMDRIFDPFFTTKGLGGGTGLGLATAYGIIKCHGGVFRVLSKKGEGTSFAFYLPAKESKANRKCFDRDTPAIINGRGNILLVDDEDGIIDVCSEMIKSLGYSVRAVTSGGAAVDHIKRNGENVDLVILDMIMPGMNGFETLKQIKSIAPNARILISSGYSKREDLLQILDPEIENFIPKPYDVAMLSEKINLAFGLGEGEAKHSKRHG